MRRGDSAVPEPYEEGLDIGRELRRAGHLRPLLLSADAERLAYKPGPQWDHFRRGVLDAFSEVQP